MPLRDYLPLIRKYFVTQMHSLAVYAKEELSVLLILNFVGGYKLELMYFSLIEPHSTPWFSATYPAAVAHRNCFCCLYQQNKSSVSRVKLIQASNCCKTVLEAAHLLILIKPESLSFHKNWGFATFGELLIVFSANVNL